MLRNCVSSPPVGQLGRVDSAESKHRLMIVLFVPYISLLPKKSFGIIFVSWKSCWPVDPAERKHRLMIVNFDPT